MITWRRLGTFAMGTGMIALGVLALPTGGAGTALIASGVGLLGLATKWPTDKTKTEVKRIIARRENRPASEITTPPPLPKTP